MKLNSQHLIIGFLVLNASLYCLSALSDDDFVGKYLPTILYHLTIRGFTRKILDFTAFMTIFLSLASYLLFRNRPPLSIFNDLSKGEITGLRLNRKLFAKLCKMYGKVMKLNRKLIAVSIFGGLLTATIIPAFYIFPFSNNSFGYLVFVQVLFIPLTFLVLDLVLTPSAYLYMTVFYLRLLIQQQKVMLKYSLLMRRAGNGAIKELLQSHGCLCKDIACHNKTWNRFYFFALFTMLPSSLFSFHSIFFGEVPHFILFGLFVAAFISTAYVFVVSTWLASVSCKFHQLKNSFFKLLVCKGGKMSIRLSINVLNCYESLASKKKIGFTCLSLFTVTYSALFKVRFEYLNRH